MSTPCADDRAPARALSTTASAQGAATRGSRDTFSPCQEISTGPPVSLLKGCQGGALKDSIPAAGGDRRFLKPCQQDSAKYQHVLQAPAPQHPAPTKIDLTAK